jgi:hypothetical protein
MFIENPHNVNLSEIDESNYHKINILSKAHTYKKLEKEQYNQSRKP